MTPILKKQNLKHVPPTIRIGYISSTTFCLSLTPPLVEVTKELLDLIEETVQDIGSDEGQLPQGIDMIHL